MPEREKSAETRRAEAETLICLMTSLSAVLKQLMGTIVPQMLEVEVDLLQVVKRHGYLAVVLVALQLYFASGPPPPPAPPGRVSVWSDHFIVCQDCTAF